MSGYWWLLAGLLTAFVILAVTSLSLIRHDKETGRPWDT
jgi:hypothetical protein